MLRTTASWPIAPAVLVGSGITAALASLGFPLAALAAAGVPLLIVLAPVLPAVLIVAVMLEMALGGWGHAVDVGSLSLRQLLVAALLATWLVGRLVRRDREWPLNGASLTVVLALVVAAVALLVSRALDHPAAMQDGLTPAFLLLFFVFSDVCRDAHGRQWLARVFIASILVLALVQIALNTIVFLGLADPHALNVRLEGLATLTVYSPRFARIFLVGSVLLPVGLLIMAAHWLAGVPLLSRARDAVALAVIGAALLLTFTRGFWLVTLIGFSLLWLLTTRSGRLRWVLATTLGLVLALPLLALQSSAASLLAQRVLALFAGGGDASVSYRLELYPRLMQRIAERPLFGYGVGYPVDGLLYVENSYLYYAIKVGLVGAVCMLAGWAWLLLGSVRLAWRGPTPAGRATGAGWAAATAAILVLTAINPFINSPVGLYFLTLGLALVGAMSRPESMGMTDRLQGVPR